MSKIPFFKGIAMKKGIGMNINLKIVN